MARILCSSIRVSIAIKVKPLVLIFTRFRVLSQTVDQQNGWVLRERAILASREIFERIERTITQQVSPRYRLTRCLSGGNDLSSTYRFRNPNPPPSLNIWPSQVVDPISL